MNKEMKQKLIALQNDMNAHGYLDGVEKLNSIFPELQENESGKIKKAITAIVNDWWDKAYCNHTCDIPREQMLNWISEQGTQESYTHRKTQEYLKGYKRVQEYEDLTDWEKMFDNVACSYANRKNNEGYNASWYVKNRAGEMLYHAKQEIERQGEQTSADKTGPKFKVGDIITPKDGGHEPWQIMQVDILDKKYRFKDGYVIHFSQEDDYELVEQKPAWSEEYLIKLADNYFDNVLIGECGLDEGTAHHCRLAYLHGLKEQLKKLKEE